MSPRKLRKIATFTVAITKFLTKGKAKFLPEEAVLNRFAICKSCEKFTGTKCLVCGCGASNRTGSLLNKLALPTEGCPDGHWPAVEKVY